MLIIEWSNFIVEYFYFYVSFNSEPRKDPGIYDMLLGECLYTFGFIVRSMGTGSMFGKVVKIVSIL